MILENEYVILIPLLTLLIGMIVGIFIGRFLKLEREEEKEKEEKKKNEFGNNVLELIKIGIGTSIAYLIIKALLNMQ